MIFFCVVYRFPFDVKNPLGYTIAVALEYIFIVNLMLPVLCLVSFALETCLVLISLTKDVKCDVNRLNENVKDNQLEILKQFSQLIEIHSDANELSPNYEKEKNHKTLI